MKVTYRNFKCPACDTGVLPMRIVEKTAGTTISIKCCNNKKCQHFVGIRGSASLEEIIDNPHPVVVKITP